MEKFSAKEAKTVADIFSESNTQEDLKVCYMAIKRDSRLGLYTTILDTAITKNAAKELREEGYHVTILSGKTHIGWISPREVEL